MVDVRSLTTVLDFAVEHAGLKEYEREVKSTLNSIKHQVQTIARLFGATIAIDLGKTLLFDLSNAVRSANRLSIQLGQILSPGEDVKAVTDDLFRIAQAIGEEYGVVGERFKTMAVTAKEVGVSTETTLKALENISKATEVNRLTGEETEQVFSQINMAMRRGVLSVRTFGELLQNAPIVVRTLGQALGKTEAQLRELAKAGKLTSDVVLKAFARDNPLLQGEWEAKADTLGEAFNYAYNWIIRIGQALWKGTRFVRHIASAIRWLTDVIVAFGRRSVAAVGGLDNALELLQITIGVIFSYYTIGMVIGLTKAIIGLGAAGALASLKFIAIAAAIGLIVIAIQDIMVWMRGGKSVTGRMLGPFAEFEKKLEPLLNAIKALTAPFEAFIKLLTGDYSGAWSALKKGFTEVSTPAEALYATLGTIGAVWTAWKVMSKFGGLLSALGDIVTAVGNVTGATTTLKDGITAAKESMIALNTLTFGPLIIAITGITAAFTAVILEKNRLDALIKKSNEDIEKDLAAGKPVPTVEKLATDLGVHPLQAREAAMATGYYKQEGFLGDANEIWQSWKRGIQETLPSSIGQYMTTTPVRPEELRVPLDTTVTPTPEPEPLFPVPPIPPPAPTEDKRSWWQRNAPSFMGGQEAVAPGAIAPVNNNEQTINNNVPINISNNITVPAEFGELDSRIRQISQETATQNMENITRQITRAAPAMEARTG